MRDRNEDNNKEVAHANGCVGGFVFEGGKFHGE